MISSICMYRMDRLPDDIVIRLFHHGCTGLVVTCRRFRDVYACLTSEARAFTLARHLTDSYGPGWAMTISLHEGRELVSTCIGVSRTDEDDSHDGVCDPTYFLYGRRSNVSVWQFWNSHCRWVFRYATHTYMLSMRSNFKFRPEYIVAAAHAWTFIHRCADVGHKLILAAMVCVVCHSPQVTKLLASIRKMYPGLGRTHAPIDERQQLWTAVGKCGSIATAELLHEYLGPSVADMCTLADAAFVSGRVVMWRWAESKGGVSVTSPA